MTLEIATLDVKLGQEAAFERAFAVASKLISAAEGHVSHELLRGIETQGRYVLLVRWKSLEAHTKSFRGSPRYLEWNKLLHHYYDPFPLVEHYTKVE